MKFGQLIEYNMRKTFVNKSCTKYCGKTIPKPFLRNQNRVYLWISSLKVLYSLFLLYANLRAIEITETKLRGTCFYLI